MDKLTPKQEKVLNLIKAAVEEQHMPPTIREIALRLGFSSTGTVRDYLAALERKGFLKRQNNKSRAIALLQEKNSISTGIPIISHIAAGTPQFAYEDIQGYVEPSELFLGRLSHTDVFALYVKGDSMVDAGILEGDIAIIKKQHAADNGDIIAALLEDNEATLKRLRQKTRQWFLEPANKNYQPIHKHFTIIGKLISVVRKY